MPRPFTPAGDGVRLAVRLTPKAAAERLIGLIADGDGGSSLKIAVTAAPEDGKANDALLRLLAKRLRLPRGAVSLLQGGRDRRKVIHIAGEPAALLARLEEELLPWLKPD
jgi:uncharacterized protein